MKVKTIRYWPGPGRYCLQYYCKTNAGGVRGTSVMPKKEELLRLARWHASRGHEVTLWAPNGRVIFQRRLDQMHTKYGIRKGHIDENGKRVKEAHQYNYGGRTSRLKSIG